MSTNSIKTAVLTGLFTLTGSAVMAADLSQAFRPAAPIYRASRNSSENWYLRGDVGYVHHKRPEADFAADPFSGGFSRENLGNAAGVGVGLGYRFSPQFRMDVTADYFNSRFKGTAPTPTFATAYVEDRARFESSTYLVNGYLDFKNGSGFTPYVGAGIGLSRNVLSNYVRATYDPTTGTETRERLAGGDDYGFAWALMAGLAYQVAPNFTLDLGYRYVGRDDLKTRSYDAGAGAHVEAIGTHEVRLGVRYGLN